MGRGGEAGFGLVGRSEVLLTGSLPRPARGRGKQVGTGWPLAALATVASLGAHPRPVRGDSGGGVAAQPRRARLARPDNYC